MVSRYNLYIRNDLDKLVEEFRDILPLLQLNLRNGVLHIPQQNQEFRVGLLQDFSEFVEQPRHLGGHMYSLVRQGHFPAEMKVSYDQDPFSFSFQEKGWLVSHWFDSNIVSH